VTSRPEGERPRVLLAGASGLIGRPLERHLRRRGYDTLRLVRRPPAAPDEILWDPQRGILDPRAVDRVHAVINLGGENAGRFLWTPSFKERFVRSRVEGTALLARTAARAERPPARLLQASASGYYGDRGDEILDESATAGTGFFADMVRRWEAATEPARAAGVPVVTMRSGIVLASTSGAMARMLPIFRSGLGGRLGPGTQWWAWITLVDEVRAILHLLDSGLTGPVNLTAPEPARNSEVTKALAAVLHRPALVPVPALALRVVVGEFAAEILSSKRLLPGALTGDGFIWRHRTLDSALRWLAA
jgi:uncharacterized protein (TIGR01777 family)